MNFRLLNRRPIVLHIYSTLRKSTVLNFYLQSGVFPFDDLILVTLLQIQLVLGSFEGSDVEQAMQEVIVDGTKTRQLAHVFTCSNQVKTPPKH